jgi:hypothetical protein
MVRVTWLDEDHHSRSPDNRVIRGHSGVVAVAHCLRDAVDLNASKRIAVTRTHIRGNGDVRKPPGSEPLDRSHTPQAPAIFLTASFTGLGAQFTHRSSSGT